MKADQIFEDAKQVICIYPGRFQPPHRGHAATYRMLEKKYGAQNTFIATSNKTDADKSPFNFAEKRALLIAAGVPAEQIVQVVNTYAAKEITDRYDLSKTIVVYAVGEKDMGTDPRFGTFTKKDGSPAYLQKMTDNPETADKHAYLVVAPTVQFQVDGKNITSASEIRDMYRSADPAHRADIIHQLYGMDTKNVENILNSKLLPQAAKSESITENFKDGKGPGRPGDAKRHGVPTKASVSTLRKVAKQGGRKGQLAHWMANMKAGKKKAAKEDYGATSATKQLTRDVAINPFDYYTPFIGEDLQLDEVSLKKIRDFAADPRLDDIMMGWELEMIWPDHNDGSHDDDEDDFESEPDYDADEAINDNSVDALRRDVMQFFRGDHNSTRDVNRVLDAFLDDYYTHLGDKWDEQYDDEDEDVRREVADRMEYGKDEDTAKDEAKDDWINDNKDDMLAAYLIDEADITSMFGFMENTGNDLNWPYYTERPDDYGYSDKGELTREDLKNMFQREFRDMLTADGYQVKAIDSPHKNKDSKTWYFEPDGSLNPGDRSEGGVELTTPPMPYKRSLEYLNKVFAWARSNGAYTSAANDTGFHMSFSLPEADMENVDWVKLILMGGDDRVLRDFDRWAGGENGWAKSALKYIREKTAEGDLNNDMILDAIKTGLTPEARREAMKYMSTGKYTSVHPKRSSKAEDTDPYTYVEFRSAGGNALGEIEKVRTAALQYARSMALAADPEAEKTLYTKKLYKLVSKVRADEPGLKALKDYTDGRIDKETLKFKLSRAAVARGQNPKYQPVGNMYVFTAGENKIEVVAPSLMQSIPDALAQADKQNKNPYYYNLVTEPGEKIWLVRTEKTYGHSMNDARRIGTVLIADNGAQAAELASDILGVPVTELTAQDRTGVLDLSDLKRVITSGWTTKQQAAAAMLADQKAAEEKAADEKAQLKSGGQRFTITIYDGHPPVYPAETHTQIAANADDAVEKFMAVNQISYHFRDRYMATPANAPTPTYTVARPGEPRQAFRMDTPEPAAADQPNPAAAETGTYIVTYLSPTGRQEQTAYDTNSMREAQVLFRLQHPASYQIVNIEAEGTQSESIAESLLAEINMGAGALADFAKSDLGQSIRVGFEAEMLVPDMKGDDDEDYDTDYEPDYDADERIRFDRNWRNQIINFWRNADFNNYHRGEIESAIEEMDEQYREYVDEEFLDLLRDGRFNDAVMSSIRDDNPDLSELSDEQIRELDNYDDLADTAESDIRDRWTSDFMNDNSNFISWAKDNSLDTMNGFSNRFDLTWPYMREISSGSGDVSMTSLADEFSKYSGYASKSGSYSTRPNNTTSVFKPDSSIRRLDLPASYAGVEFASAYMPLSQTLDMLQKFYKWAGSIGAEANASCGFHMGVSVPEHTRDTVDVIKFILFLGDEKVLTDFGREASQWCQSSLKKIAKNNTENQIRNALEEFRSGLNTEAAKMMKRRLLPSGDRYVSVNFKDDYIEIRSAGGNFLEQKDLILNTMLRYVRVLGVAASPEEAVQEYAKKLYKILSKNVRGENPDTIQYFAQYAAGTLPSTALKSFVRQAQSKRDQDRKTKAQVANPNAGKDWVAYYVLRADDNFKVHEFLAPDNFTAAQVKMDDYIMRLGLDPNDYYIKKAGQASVQQPTAQPAPAERQRFQIVDRNGRPIPEFNNGYTINNNGVFSTNNQSHAEEVAQTWNSNYGLPDGYQVRPFGQTESREHRSLYHSIVEQEQLAEITQNPRAFRKFLNSEVANQVTMGFEAEMCIRGLDVNSRARPQIPADLDAEAIYPFDETGEEHYREFWQENDANTSQAVSQALQRLLLLLLLLLLPPSPPLLPWLVQ